MMTIDFDNPRRLETIANGVDVNFPYNYLIFQETDLIVTVDKILQFVNADYSVTGVNTQGGGNVVFFTAPLDTAEVIIDSDVPQTQTVDFEVGGKFKPDTVNFVNDKLTVIDQQTQVLIRQRGLLYPETAFLDQNGKDNLLPILQAQTLTEIPIWSKDLNNNIIATVLEEAGDLSNLRAELASETQPSPGAELVGYFDPQSGLGTTVNDKLKQIQNESLIGTNVVIGGDFGNNIFSRGTTFTAMTGSPSTFVANGFFFSSTNAPAAVDVDSSRPNGGPPFALFNKRSTFFLELTNQAVVTPIAADEDLVLVYIIEGFDWAPLYQNPFVIQFAVKSNLIGTYNIILQNNAFDLHYATPFIINVANTWQKIQLLIPANPDQGAWDFQAGRGLVINFVLAAGSDLFGPSNVWGQTLGTDVGVDSNQVNFVETIGNNFSVQFLNVAPGTVPTPLPIENIATEVLREHRYFQKSYDNGIVPGAVNTSIIRFIAPLAAPFTTRDFPFPEKVREAGTGPAIVATLFSPVTGASGMVRNITQGADVAVSNVIVTESGVGFDLAAGVAAGDGIELHWTVDSSIT